MSPGFQTHIALFIFNLSFLDLCFTTSVVPQMLVKLWGPEKIISYAGCIIQLYLYMWLDSVECLVLAVMSYDRFTAVCTLAWLGNNEPTSEFQDGCGGLGC